jgi:V8-like Glu-specific endopeptidase
MTLMKKTSIRLLCWVIVLFLTASATLGQTAQEIAKKAFGSTVLLMMEDKSGQPISLGSGFFVRENIIATNLHVVEGATTGYAKIVGKKQKYDVAGYVAIDNKMDLVLLKINDANVPSLPLGNSSKTAIGDEIYAVGNPQGLEGTFSKGIISAIRTIEKDTLLQITAPISPGSSGGPILNNEGNVIGISIATFKGGQNLNFAIPASYLATLLDNIKSVKLLSVKEKPEKEVKSILEDFGGHNTEGVVGEKLTWGHQLYDMDGNFSFTLRNQLTESVQNVYCLIIFYDKDGSPLDITLINYPSIIPGNLAKRVNGSVDKSIKRLTTPTSKDNQYESSFTPSTKVEFRILNFQIVE